MSRRLPRPSTASTSVSPDRSPRTSGRHHRQGRPAPGVVPGDADGVLVRVVGFAVTQVRRRRPGTACAWVAAAASPAGARPACRPVAQVHSFGHGSFKLPHLGGASAHLLTAAVQPAVTGVHRRLRRHRRAVVASTTPTTSAPTRAVQPRRTRPLRPATAARRACGRRQAREARQCPCRAWQLAGRTCRAEHTRPFPTVWRPQRTRKAYQLMIVGTLPSCPRSSGCSTGFRREDPARPGPSGTDARSTAAHCPCPTLGCSL